MTMMKLTLNYTQNTNKKITQMHFSQPWRLPSFNGRLGVTQSVPRHTTTNQDYCLSFLPVEDMVGRDGMPLRY